MRASFASTRPTRAHGTTALTEQADGRVVIHTDGACSGNPGVGGWGAILEWGDHRREIKGGELPGTIGPPLRDIKSKYPDRNELLAILNDETKRNPATMMPPFGRNRILTEQEIDAIVDFLETL